MMAWVSTIGELSPFLFLVLIPCTEGQPFPDDRDQLVHFLTQGLSLRHLLPREGSEEHGRIVCKSRLRLVGAFWWHGQVCNKEERTMESYQRHVKTAHLGAHRLRRLSVEAIVKGTLHVMSGVRIAHIPDRFYRVGI